MLVRFDQRHQMSVLSHVWERWCNYWGEMRRLPHGARPWGAHRADGDIFFQKIELQGVQLPIILPCMTTTPLTILLSNIVRFMCSVSVTKEVFYPVQIISDSTNLHLDHQFIVADWIDSFKCFSDSVKRESRATVDQWGRWCILGVSLATHLKETGPSTPKFLAPLRSPVRLEL